MRRAGIIALLNIMVLSVELDEKELELDGRRNIEHTCQITKLRENLCKPPQPDSMIHPMKMILGVNGAEEEPDCRICRLGSTQELIGKLNRNGSRRIIALQKGSPCLNRDQENVAAT